VANQEKFFSALGTKVRELRKKRGYSQEDMISFGFSARHFQQIEAGRPITATTMLRLCEVLEVSMEAREGAGRGDLREARARASPASSKTTYMTRVADEPSSAIVVRPIRRSVRAMRRSNLSLGVAECPTWRPEQ
jgi:transcriptional regulator with XRE-family HTH domain